MKKDLLRNMLDTLTDKIIDDYELGRIEFKFDGTWHSFQTALKINDAVYKITMPVKLEKQKIFGNEQEQESESE